MANFFKAGESHIFKGVSLLLGRYIAGKVWGSVAL